MTLAVESRRKLTEGLIPPQIAPPLPLKGELDKFVEAATLAGITLMPWQVHAARYLTAIGTSGWLYPEVAIVVPRQNGKTTLLLPRIIAGLLAGERIMHTAQNRELPREIFNLVADALDKSLMRHPPRVANGQERIDMLNGGVYRIVAPSRGGARGPTNDTVIVDEAREFTDFEFIAAAKPTLTVSERPQMIYLSNAGSDASVMLNALRRRADKDRDLAYIEWNSPGRFAIDDREGWKVANPAHTSKPQLLATLEREYRASLESSTLAVFETEHLCRWPITMQPKLVSEHAWLACAADLDDPVRPSIAFNMDPTGKRASAAMSWQLGDGRIALVELREATGDPIDTKALGTDLQDLARTHRARKVAFASWTDKELARYVQNATALDGKDFANASEHFARLVNSGRLAWDGAAHIGDDLNWTARKPHEAGSGAWTAVPATNERSITAVLAAIRAVWLASAPKPSVPRIA